MPLSSTSVLAQNGSSSLRPARGEEGIDASEAVESDVRRAMGEGVGISEDVQVDSGIRWTPPVASA
jgi:hypothetical protein